MTDESAALATTETESTPEIEQTALRAAPTETHQATETVGIPDKFQVKRDDGSIDYEASSAKMAQSYSYLEKKLGTGDAPPKSHEEYQVTFSEDTPITYDDIKSDPVLQDFMQGAHGLGMTNAQVSYVLDQYLKVLPQDIEAHASLTANETIETLKGTWKTEQELNAGLADARRAVEMVAGEDAEYFMDNYGNDPKFIRFMAEFGRGLREDSPPQAMQMIEPQQFTEITHDLRQQLIDMPKNDPRREGILSKLDQLYKQQVGDSPAYGLG